eukprot:CAMPEP_0171147726 /NCGR_PEP_ID=MMETSP0766_2-20121228/148210_1 /TAXON_ID=439317 /ORGANISM="Gambierdiscus australes, Strain CAWD 149" /LENGTH=744 /DNA_ID=CAMNT_0011611635 /DNA_START=106 /DNA_END=2336 /DNA_ORIENTATION=+
MADAVEEFIQVNEVDGSAADALRECSRSVQAAVIDRGGLSGARNPSSVLLARIRDASAPPLNETDMDSAGFVRLRGIPFSATTDDILRFFDGLSPLSESVVIGTTREGRLSGEAFVQFPSVVHAKEAIEQRHRATMGDRYIELFPSTPGEAQRAAHGEPRHGGGWHDRHDDRSSHRWSDSASDRAASADEVEQFLSSSTIDDHAQAALRELSPYMQAAVIDRGGLGNARNPSSVLLSRIRDVQNGVVNTPPPPPPSAGAPRGSKAERVERFLEENSVDEQASEVFRNCHPDVQEEVMSRPVASARNPSSALRARIRDVEQNLMGGGGQARASQAPSRSNRDNLVSAVEDFIQQNGIDERAADALRNSQPRTQEAVLDRGDFVGVRNPSSAVLARIRAADAHLARSDGNNADRGDYGYHDDGYGGGRSRDGRPYNIEDAVEEFIRANYLDERASEALRGCPPHVQEEVLHRGDLAGTRNPSSALVARLKDIQGPVSGPRRGGEGGGPPPQPAPAPVAVPGGLVDDIEYLLRLYAERDDRAADALGRLRSVKYSMGYYGDRPPGPPPPTRSRSYSPRGSRHYNDRDRLEDYIEGFVRANGIDAKAADALRRADPRMAYVVMEKGVSGARNPSSALLARLRDMETYGAPGGRDRAYDPEPPPRKRGRLEDDVEAFIRANGVDDMAADTLRRCSPELQEVVMEKGVAGARNPSSALLARIRDLDTRMGGGGDRRSYGGNAPPRRGGDR